MTSIRIDAQLRRVGNALAILIPAAESRRARLHEGQSVNVEVSTKPFNPVGALAHLGLPEFRRTEMGDADRY